jgi:hypothetical protein
VGITAKGPEEEDDDTGGIGAGEGFDGPDDDPNAGDDAGQVAYELDTWSGATRTLLDGMLENASIPHAWEAGTLVIDAEHEAAVDLLVDEAEASAGPVLDPDAAKVAYEVGEWDDSEVDKLVDLLTEAKIGYDWDENGDLLVLEEDEERAEDIFDRLEDAAAGADSGGAGLQAAEVLSELFVASDRLMHDAEDHEGVLSLVDASKLAEKLPLPFGFDAEVWAEIVAKAAALRRAFEEDVDDDNEIVERATDLRTVLREYV